MKNLAQKIDICKEIKTPSKFKKILLENAPKHLAITGRVLEWLKSPYDDRLPVSCTIYQVEDSMEGPGGIEESFTFVSHGLRKGAGVALDLSKIRPAGSENGKGLTASGPLSFAKIYSKLNQILRRGGVYKNGAITIYLDAEHPDLKLFLQDDPELNWVKKAIYIGEEYLKHPLRQEIAEAVDSGRVWLAKRNYDKDGERLFSNVCLEILIKHAATCLISNINYAKIQFSYQIPKIMEEAMYWLCTLHGLTGVDKGGHYRSPEDDKQVGLGVIGFASFLAMQKITYKGYLEALMYYADLTSDFREEVVLAFDYQIEKYLVSGTHYEDLPVEIQTIIGYKALEFVHYRAVGFHRAARVASKFGMERAFTVAPTANSFTNHKDLYEEYSVTPEISAPVGKAVERISETLETKTYKFHPNVETAAEVGWEVHSKVVEFEQLMMNATGLAHTISFNIWDTVKVTPDWIDKFITESPLQTTYYRLSINQQTNVKNRQLTEKEIESLAYGQGEEYESNSDLDGLFDELFEPKVESCNLDGYCEACGGD